MARCNLACLGYGKSRTPIRWLMPSRAGRRDHDPRRPATAALARLDLVEAEIIDDIPTDDELITRGRAALVDAGVDPDDWVDAETDAQLNRATPKNTVSVMCWAFGRSIFWCGRTGRKHDPMAVGSVRQYIKDHWEMRNSRGERRGRGGQPYAPATVELAVYGLSMVYDRLQWPNPVGHPLIELQLEGYAEDFAAANFKTHESDPLTHDKSVALARAQDLGTVQGLRNATMLRNQFDTGCRANELCHVQMEDLQWDSEDKVRIKFRRTKGRQERTVTVQAVRNVDWDVDPVRLLLALYRALRSAGYGPAGPMFPNVRVGQRRKDFEETGILGGRFLDTQIERKAYEDVFNRAVARTGIDLDPVTKERTYHFTTHSNRSGMITRAIQAGMSREWIRRRSGHALGSPTFERYFRPEGEDEGDNAGVAIRRAAQALRRRREQQEATDDG